MRRIMLLSVKLLVGLFTCAVGVVMTINGNLGLAPPWDVFHQGLSNLLGITIGRAYIAVGIVLIVINSLLGKNRLGGTFFNMLLIGIFIDF